MLIEIENKPKSGLVNKCGAREMAQMLRALVALA